MTEQSKSYDDFIATVWAFESDIDPSKKNYYDENWLKPVAGPYPEVDKPGRVKRDPGTGDPILSGSITIRELFSVIGLSNLYDPTDPNPDWMKIQANVINYLGFVGFQFQESDLQVLGYYNYPIVTYEGKQYPSHYVDVPNSNWKNGVTQFLDTDPSEVNEPTVVTDVVQFFDPQFTGKNGVSSVADFKDPKKHVTIIKDHFANKHEGIVSGLAARGKTLANYIDTEVKWDGLTPPVSPPTGGTIQ